MAKLFGEYLSEFYKKAKNKDKSYSQQRLADDIGVNMRTFYSWIRGRKVPRDRTIVPKIAEYFSNLLGKKVTAQELDASIEAQIAQVKKSKEKATVSVAKTKVAKTKVAKTKEVEVKITGEQISETLDRVINELVRIKDCAQLSTQLQKDEEELLRNYRKLPAQAKRDVSAYCRFKGEQK